MTSNDGLTNEEIQKLREISIFSILGVRENGRRVGIPCPIHNGGNNNFNLYPDNSYHCFKCEAHGSNGIDLLRDLKGYPKKMSSGQFLEVVSELVSFLA